MSPETDPRRERLESLKASLLQRLKKIDGDLERKQGALDQDFEEQAVQTENDETLDALDDVTRKELDQIERALSDLDKGKYGKCRHCGCEIGEERMEALPYAILCVACAESAESG